MKENKIKVISCLLLLCIMTVGHSTYEDNGRILKVIAENQQSQEELDEIEEKLHGHFWSWYRAVFAER